MKMNIKKCILFFVFTFASLAGLLLLMLPTKAVRAAAICMHNGQAYSEGAEVCMRGATYYCSYDGKWEFLKGSCD